LLIKYIESILWIVAKYLSYIEDALCLKVNFYTFLHVKPRFQNACTTLRLLVPSANNAPFLATLVITIWHYKPLWICAFSTKSPQDLLSLAVSFQFFTFSFFRSSMTSSYHRCLVLPTGLFPIGLQSNNFVVGLAWSFPWICPTHLILYALVNLTISATSIN